MAHFQQSGEWFKRVALMKKKEVKMSKQFPNIFRFIPETKLIKKIIKSKKTFYVTLGFSLGVSLILFLGIMIVLAALYININEFSVLIKTRQEVKAKISFWKSITNKYDGYKDAYFQQALLEYSLGAIKNAKQTNLNALLLDPNSSDAKKLKTLLDTK